MVSTTSLVVVVVVVLTLGNAPLSIILSNPFLSNPRPSICFKAAALSIPVFLDNASAALPNLFFIPPKPPNAVIPALKALTPASINAPVACPDNWSACWVKASAFTPAAAALSSNIAAILAPSISSAAARFMSISSFC